MATNVKLQKKRNTIWKYLRRRIFLEGFEGGMQGGKSLLQIAFLGIFLFNPSLCLIEL